MRSTRDKERAYGYIRVSTDEQVHEGLSLELQEDRVIAYAKAQNLELIEVIRDEGLSAKDLNRPGLQRVLELIRGGEAETLLVLRLDRLTRRTRDLLWLVEDVFEKTNTRLLSLSENIDTQSAMGKYFLTNFGALAQMERELISERTKAALAMKKKKGEPVGKPALGFRMENGERVVEEDELALVKKIKSWRKRGTSYGKIAKRLNREGPMPKRGKEWYASSVRYICKNKLYRGNS